jgi:Xaa-Pro aminopeptidase
LKERDLTGRVGLELSQGTQSADRMVGEPTTWTQPWFDAFKPVAREVIDATGLLAEARAIKTEQEIQRMKLANELAALAMEHTFERSASRNEGERSRGHLRRFRACHRHWLQRQG